MNYWKISTKNKSNIYLIIKQDAILFARFDDESDIENTIKEKTFNRADVYDFKRLRDIVLIDTDNTIKLNSKYKELEDKKIVLDKNNFEEIKAYLLENIQNVEIKNYSLFRQLILKIFAALVSILLALVLYSTAISTQSGEGVAIKGGRRVAGEFIIASVAKIFGPVGSLILGGTIAIVFIYLTYRRIKKPKLGKVIKTNKLSTIMEK